MGSASGSLPDALRRHRLCCHPHPRALRVCGRLMAQRQGLLLTPCSVTDVANTLTRVRCAAARLITAFPWLVTSVTARRSACGARTSAPP